jgi:hypothetical protein
MTTFSYLYLRMDLTPLGSAGGVLRGLIDYILSPEGQALAKDFQFEPVPQKVLDLNKQAMSMLQFAKDAPMWDFELPGTTRPIAGASLYTFSGKRRDTDLYQISLLENKARAHARMLEWRVAISVLVGTGSCHGGEHEGNEQHDDGNLCILIWDSVCQAR